MGKRKKRKKKWRFESFDFRKEERVLSIEPNIYTKMMSYVQLSPGEISGFGRVVEKSKKLKVIDALIFKQKVSAGGTTLNGKQLTEFVVRMAREGKNPADWNLWWHSHPTFGVFFSGTDTSTIAQLSKGTTLYAICMNRAGDMVARVDVDGVEETLKPCVGFDENDEIYKQCARDVKALVKEEVFKGGWRQKHCKEYYSSYYRDHRRKDLYGNDYKGLSYYKNKYKDNYDEYYKDYYTSQAERLRKKKLEQAKREIGKKVHYVWDKKRRIFTKYVNGQPVNDEGDTLTNELHSSVGDSKPATISAKGHHTNRGRLVRERGMLVFDKNGVYMGRSVR